MSNERTAAEVAADTRKIDLNRGVTKRSHAATGVDVYMYKDTPGEYLDGHGNKVSLNLAKEAGFDVEQHAKLLAFKQKRDEINAKLKAEMDVALEEDRVIAERRGYKVRFVGSGLYQVLDPSGLALNSINLPRETALKLLDEIVEPEPEPAKVKIKPLAS